MKDDYHFKLSMMILALIAVSIFFIKIYFVSTPDKAAPEQAIPKETTKEFSLQLGHVHVEGGGIFNTPEESKDYHKHDAAKANKKKTIAPSKKVEKVAASTNEKKEWSKDELMATGEGVYNVKCSGCHKKDGSGMPPMFPAMKGSAIANGAAADHIGLVLGGQGAMPAFEMLSDTDLASVITYERNAFGNTGSVVKPADIKSAR